MLFCNVFWMRDNNVRESHIVFGYDKTQVYEQVRNVFVDLGEKAFHNWDEYDIILIDSAIEEGGEKYVDNDGGVFIEWVDPTNIHLTE